jgi:hypothetical protein
MDPRCRYCGKPRSESLLLAKSQNRDISGIPESICPNDGHLLPPAPPDCEGCRGACVECEDGHLPVGVACPECGHVRV